MAQPIFSLTENSAFEEKIKEISGDNISYSGYKSRETAINSVRNAYYAQAVSRIRKDRMEDLLNYLLIIVGSRGEFANVLIWEAFTYPDNEEYCTLLRQLGTPLNHRYLHMFLKAILVAHRNWALTAFVKFLRGNKVAGGKANEIEGFGSFHKDSGWNELQVNAVASVLFDERSITSKLFMQYDADLTDKIYQESEKSLDIPYSARFAATSKIVNKEFITELISLLEKRELAPLPTNPKKAFKPRVPKVFKPGDIIQKNTISDLPPLSIIEIKVIIRMKRDDANTRSTVQIVLVKKAEPRYDLNIWRISNGKAYFPGSRYGGFDQERRALEGAIYKGQWESGVQVQDDPYAYPHDYIGLDKF